MLVAKESEFDIFFIAGRQKSDPGTDFSDANVAQAQVIDEAMQKVSAKKLGALIEDGVLKRYAMAARKTDRVSAEMVEIAPVEEP